MVKVLWFINVILVSTVSAQTKEDIIFQCESKYENLTLNLKSTKEKVTAVFSVPGNTYICEAPISFFDLTDAQISKYEANIAFTAGCTPKLSPTLAKTLAVEMKLTVPVEENKTSEISWINYRKAQKCMPGKNRLAETLKVK